MKPSANIETAGGGVNYSGWIVGRRIRTWRISESVDMTLVKYTRKLLENMTVIK